MRCQFSDNNSDDEDVSLYGQVALWMIYFDIWDQRYKMMEGLWKMLDIK
jgi:hypothetical protein